jgi:cell division ATPase FtsA
MPEGFCAYLGILFDMRRKIRPAYSHLKNETTIIFDIGAGTTDISVIEDGKIISATKYTVTLGGNNVHQKVKSMLNASGKSYPESMVQEGVEKGYLKSGNVRQSLVKEIGKAKNEIARGIVNSVRDFFESSQYPIEKIENMIVCGGGAIDTKIEGVHPLSEYLVEYMKRLTENITLVELPRIAGDDGVEDVVSPRILNVLGAGIATYRD